MVGGGGGGVRVSGEAVLRYFWCGLAVIFIFNPRYYGFKTQNGLRLLQSFKSRFSVITLLITLFRTGGIRSFFKRELKVFFLTMAKI